MASSFNSEMRTTPPTSLLIRHTLPYIIQGEVRLDNAFVRKIDTKQFSVDVDGFAEKGCTIEADSGAVAAEWTAAIEQHVHFVQASASAPTASEIAARSPAASVHTIKQNGVVGILVTPEAGWVIKAIRASGEKVCCVIAYDCHFFVV
jgi:hypothetical protein